MKGYVKERLIHEENYPPKVVARLKVYLAQAKKLAGEKGLYRRRVDWYEEIHQSFFEENRLWHYWKDRWITVTCKKVSRADSPWWEGLKKHELKKQMFGKEPARRTVCSFAHDGEYMLVHAELFCKEPSKLRANGARNQDPSILRDDMLKVCFDLDDRAYYHYVAANSKGLIKTGVQAIPLEIRGLDLPGLSKDWPVSGIKVKATIGKDRWTLDLEIPFSIFSDWDLDKGFYERGLRMQVATNRRTTLSPTLQQVWSFPTTRFAVAEFLP